MACSVVTRKLSFWCLMVLAAVAAHALLPFSLDARRTGSAFSPSTVDVVTPQARRDGHARNMVGEPDPDRDRLRAPSAPASLLPASLLPSLAAMLALVVSLRALRAQPVLARPDPTPAMRWHGASSRHSRAPPTR